VADGPGAGQDAEGCETHSLGGRSAECSLRGRQNDRVLGPKPSAKPRFGPLMERLRIMKRIIGTAVALCLLAGSQAIARSPDKKAVETTTQQTQSGVTLKTEKQAWSYGAVTGPFEP
jgi:hypothetical protein